MDKEIRNKLRNVVTDCRRILEASLSEQLQGKFGIHKDGQIEDESHMSHLLPDEREYRRQLITHIEHIQAKGFKPTEAIEQLIREVAFTHLNRLCSYKMLEERKYIRESVSRGLESNGFKRYLADNPEDEKLWSSGQQDIAYHHFLNWLGSTLSEEIGVLFSPNDPSNRLYPPERIIEQMLVLINQDELKEIWSQDETIGWIYQYFTPKELRDKARKESQAPRNSYELAFRNQFYTPRYIVQFLTDNTLGRTWYEMRQGNTILKDRCEYLVHRPDEVFLKKDEVVPQVTPNYNDLSQEELLKQPVYIKFREKKDPRDIKILDPACGSGHFLLYCFDILETIYRESYNDTDAPAFSINGKTLREEFSDEISLAIAIPSMILRYNLHGIDIDLRATQIASLGLWLKAQKAFYILGLTNESRLKITRMNIVCAEPMPGEKELLEDFIKDLKPVVLGDLIRVVFDKMTQVNEIGSLLKIDVELHDAIKNAKQQWLTKPKSEQLTLFPTDRQHQWNQSVIYNVKGITDASFWQEAEDRVIEALKKYSSHASNGSEFLINLFTEDAEKGFSFIELCQKEYDIILMNPPFGDTSKLSKKYIEDTYPLTKNDLYATFIERGIEKIVDNGMLGAITSRTGFFLSSFKNWREQVLLNNVEISTLCDLGSNILDTAMVETAAYCINKSQLPISSCFIRVLKYNDNEKKININNSIRDINNGVQNYNVFIKFQDDFEILPDSPFVYWVPINIQNKLAIGKSLDPTIANVKCGLSTGDNSRFVRAFWEVSPASIYHKWYPIVMLGNSQPWFSPMTVLVNWGDDGKDITDYSGSTIRNEEYYFKPGFSWTRRAVRFIPYIIPRDCIPSASRYMAYPNSDILFTTLGIVSSNIASAYLRFYGEKFEFPNFLVDNVKSIPIPEISNDLKSLIEKKAIEEFSYRRSYYQYFEPFQEFIAPSIIYKNELNLSWNPYSLIGDNLEKDIANMYGLSENELKILTRDLDEAIASRKGNDNQKEDDDDESLILYNDEKSQHIAFISYCLGVVFGRWDIRIVLNNSLIPKFPEPFDAVPRCPLGMLMGPDCLPAKSNNIVSEEWLLQRSQAINQNSEIHVNVSTIDDSKYPVNINWDGILVDEEGNTNDIVKRIRDVYNIIWGENAESIERKTCELLNVRTIRDYIKKPGKSGLWDDHIKIYSKSRRKAPIYWLLQSSKKNYGLWIYYHRLNRDTLYKALEHYIKPKIQHEENRLCEIKSKRNNAINNGNSTKKIDSELDKTESLITELIEFRDALNRVVILDLTPDFDDGILLNIAPLHEFIPWSDVEKTWYELLQNKYEWSSIGKQLRAKGLVKDSKK